MKNLLEIHIAVVLFGLAGLFGKLVSLPPGMIVLGRAVFAAAFILSARVLTKKALRVPGRNACFSFLLPGVVLAVHWVTFFKFIQQRIYAQVSQTISCFLSFRCVARTL